MAIVKATYTKSKAAAKATIRYLVHRPGRDGRQARRELFGIDGVLAKSQAYRMIDEAKRGTAFFRLVISPDPNQEDMQKDLYLWEITTQTLLRLEERLHKDIPFLAVEHTDHTPHRHVHVVALVAGRLIPQDFKALREAATAAALLQRQERDLAREQKARDVEEAQWEC